MTLILILLVALTGGSSYEALSEHGKIQQIHAQAAQSAVTIAQLKTSISTQQTAIDKEQADKTAADAASAKKSQIRSTYEIAAGVELQANPPAVPEAIQLNSLALGAGDPPEPATVTAGQALGAANAKEQAIEIAELQGELKQAVDAKNTAEADFQADHKQVVTLAGTNATLTAAVGADNVKVTSLSADNTSLEGKLGLAVAKAGKYVFWIAIAVGALFLLTWIFPAFARDIPVLAKMAMGIGHAIAHPLVALWGDVIDDGKAALAAEQAAHAQTKAALAATVNPKAS